MIGGQRAYNQKVKLQLQALKSTRVLSTLLHSESQSQGLKQTSPRVFNSPVHVEFPPGCSRLHTLLRVVQASAAVFVSIQWLCRIRLSKAYSFGVMSKPCQRNARTRDPRKYMPLRRSTFSVSSKRLWQTLRHLHSHRQASKGPLLF
jgi:hypothetical protein